MNIRGKQQGLALLILVTLLAGAAATAAIKALSRSDDQTARDKITQAALTYAKDALIGYAITYGDTHAGQVHGYLPCPDQAGGNPEGSAEPTCGSQDVSQLGRLPWRTLDLGALRGADGECLWYAVSGNYKNNPKTGLMNWDTNGQIRVYDSDGTLLTPTDNQAVAVIFSPGMASSGQNRSGSAATVCGGNYTASNYLDEKDGFNNALVSTIAGAISQFRMGDHTQTGDRLVFITRQDIWNALKKRSNFSSTLETMTRKTAECIANFGSKNSVDGIADPTNMSLPWPAPLSLADYSDNVIMTMQSTCSPDAPPTR